jgi:hypothetical protein
MQQAFSGFFDVNECDVAFKDHNLDICEAAYKLACDAQENRFKVQMPLAESVLLCESLINEPPEGKKMVDFDIQVQEGSLLNPDCLHQGKWIINGETLAFHYNLMEQGCNVYLFSTNVYDENHLKTDDKKDDKKDKALE